MSATTQPITKAFETAVAAVPTARPLLVHKLATVMWLPMLLMGTMALATAVVLGIVRAGFAENLGAGFDAVDRANVETLRPLVDGFLFLGMALVLAGISFLLATILGALHAGGGEVQAAAGATARALRMPFSAKAFIVLMMLGVSGAVAAFVTQIVIATTAHDAWIGATAAGVPGDAGDLGRVLTVGAWANPLALTSIGMLLSGIALALYTISNVLDFQFTRVRELATGQEESR